MTRKWSASLFLLFFSAGYLIQKLGWLPVIKYYPHLHQWSFADGLDAEGPTMKWYGRIVGCTLLAVGGWLIGILIEKRVSEDSRALAVLDCGAWVSAFFVMVYTTVYELNRWVFN